MCAPWYRDIQSEELPQFTTADDVTVRVIAGSSRGVQGAVQREHTEPLYLDLHLPVGASFAQPLPAAFNAFIYVYRGSVDVGGKQVTAQHMAILKNGSDLDGVVIGADQPARVLLIAGKPLHEPIVQYGPFVMNTQAQILQTINDYREGNFAQA